MMKIFYHFSYLVTSIQSISNPAFTGFKQTSYLSLIHISYKVGKVNVDAEPALAAQFGIMNIPTVLVFKNGQVVEKSIGLVQKSQLAALLK